MHSGRPYPPDGPRRLAGDLFGSVPIDVWVLLGIIFATFTLASFSATALIPALMKLVPDLLVRGALWQPVSYPFVGTGVPGFWFVVELVILLMFGKDVFYRLGRKQFWRMLLGVAAVAGLLATGAWFLIRWAYPAGALGVPLILMQGQSMVLAILIAAFATLNGSATIYLFFVLPIQARWFLGLEILFAFLGFLSTKDLPGFVGIVSAVGLTYAYIRPGRWQYVMRRGWLKLREQWLRLRLQWLKRRRGLRVVKGDGQDRWVN